MKSRAAVALVMLLLLLLPVLLWVLGTCQAAPLPQEWRGVDSSPGAAGVLRDSGSIPQDARSIERAEAAATYGDSARHVRLQVVTLVDDPVAGAEVLYWPPRTAAARVTDQKAMNDGAQIEACLRATGRVAISDGDGRVEIDADADSQLCARRDDLHGELDLSAYDKAACATLRLEVQRAVRLEVEVVDSDGKPAPGCLIELHGSISNARSDRGGAWERLGQSDADGRLVVADLSTVFVNEEHAADASFKVLCVRDVSDTPGPIVAEQSLPWPLPRDSVSVRLVVPAGGTIAVTMLDADGLTADASVWLSGMDDQTFDDHPIEERGRLLFRRVPTGRRWVVTARLDGLGRDTRLELDGPRTANEVVEATMRLPSRSWEIVGRVVRSDGRAVVDAEVNSTCPGLLDETWVRRTSADGSIPCFVVTRPAGLTEASPLVLQITSPIAQSRTIIVDHPIHPGRSDLGDLVLQPPPGETKLASVEIRCEGRLLDQSTWAKLVTSGADQFHEVPTVVDRHDGVFEFRGVPPSQPLLLDCGHPDCRYLGAVPLRVGEHRVVDLPRAARLLVAVLAPSIPRDDVHAILLPATQPFDDEADTNSMDSEQQTFRWGGLEPGDYHLRILAEKRIVYEQAHLELQAGDNRWPPGGSRLDLRGTARALYFAARSATTGASVNPEGLLVPVGATTIPVEDEQDLRERWFFPPSQPSDLLVRRWGFVPVRVPSPTQDVVLRLQPTTELEVTCEGARSEAIHAHFAFDAVTDPLLRAFDEAQPHAAEFDLPDQRSDRRFAPGSVLDLTVMRNGKPGPPQRVVVGDQSPQQVVLR